jgi:hypothetical protein
MRRLAIVAAALALTAFGAFSTSAANTQLRQFGTGDVTISGSSATIANHAGEYGGVYLNSKSWSGKLADVQMSFVSAGDNGGGAPRFSIPIDNDGNAAVDGYAFIDVNSCGGNATVSTTSSNCMVYFHTEPAPYANWAAFAAAHPTWRIAPGAIPFIIADVAGNYSVRNISFR